jgi:hypothetical protein
MSAKEDRAIQALLARNAEPYRTARANYYAAELTLQQAATQVGAAGRKHYATLYAEMRRQLAPHTIDWREQTPSGAADVRGDDWTCGLCLTGSVWPHRAGRSYAIQARTPISFTLHPRDGAEFRRAIAGLKAAADALAAMLFDPAA